MGCSKGSSKREVYSNTLPPQETKKQTNKQKTSSRQPEFTCQTTGKRTTTTTTTKTLKISRRKDITKIRANINEKKQKKQ